MVTRKYKCEIRTEKMTKPCSAKTLMKLADNEIDPILAVTLQKLKVEGNIDKALRFKELIDSYRK